MASLGHSELSRVPNPTSKELNIDLYIKEICTETSLNTIFFIRKYNFMQNIEPLVFIDGKKI